MPRFSIRFRSGRLRSQIKVSAATPAEAAEFVERTRNGRVIRIVRLRGDALTDRRLKASPHSVVACLESLEFLMLAGARVDTAIRSLVERLPNGTLRHVWVEILSALESTGNFSSALGRFPRIFDETVVGIALAAETAGQMAEGIGQMAAYLRQVELIRGQVRRGFVYPGILLALSMVTLGVLCEFTLPRYQAMLEGMGVSKFNVLTDLAFRFGGALHRRPWLLLGAIPVAVLGFRIWRFPSVRRWATRAVFRVPLFSAAFEAVVLSRFCATFVGLHRAGFRPVEALSVCAKAVGNIVYRESLERVVRGLKENLPIGEAFARSRGFSHDFVVAIRSGESDLGAVFGRLGEFYGEAARTRIDVVIKLVEPTLLMVVIGVVFGTSLAVILPMVDIVESLHS